MKKTISIFTILILASILIFGSVSTASAAGAVRNTDVTSATAGNTLIMYEGDFQYVSKDTILARLNAIRYEACSQGMYGLTMSDYVPLRWSSDMEWIAQTRAAEAALYHSHTRPNWTYCESLRHNGVASDNECLYWGGSVSIMGAIESWYSEKFDSGDTSHYRAIIDPDARQVAIGGFVPTAGWGAVAAEFTPLSNLYEDQTGSSGRFTQILEVDSSKVSVTSVDVPSTVHIGMPKDSVIYGTANFSSSASVRLTGSFNWSSSNTGIATVSSHGQVTGVNAGTATITITFRGKSVSDTVKVEGHNWTGRGTDKEPTCIEEGVGYLSCSVCGVKKAGSEYTIDKIPHPYGEWTTRIPATCTDDGSRKKVCRICGDTVVEAVPALGHDWDRWRVTKRATASEEGLETRVCKTDGTHFETRAIPVKNSDEEEQTRIYGDTRFETSLLMADEYKDRLGIDKFNAVIIAYGRKYADALAGSYLSCVLEAPILLVDSRQDHISAVQEYITANMNTGSSIYLLGGEAVVPNSVVAGLDGYKVTRLWGKDRYETNIAILNEAAKYTNDKEIMVCSGSGFADSLSAAALGRPILLVKPNLQDTQRHYLKLLGESKTFYIIGGEGAVTPSVEKELNVYGTTARIGGDTRYETSVNVAKQFFKNPECGVFAFGQDFPDGLCGGALAYAMDAPLILTSDGRTSAAETYAKDSDMISGIVLGGPSLIGDDSVNRIFGLVTEPEEEEPVLTEGTENACDEQLSDEAADELGSDNTAPGEGDAAADAAETSGEEAANETTADDDVETSDSDNNNEETPEI